MSTFEVPCDGFAIGGERIWVLRQGRVMGLDVASGSVHQLADGLPALSQLVGASPDHVYAITAGNALIEISGEQHRVYAPRPTFADTVVLDDAHLMRLENERAVCTASADCNAVVWERTHVSQLHERTQKGHVALVEGDTLRFVDVATGTQVDAIEVGGRIVGSAIGDGWRVVWMVRADGMLLRAARNLDLATWVQTRSQRLKDPLLHDVLGQRALVSLAGNLCLIDEARLVQSVERRDVPVLRARTIGDLCVSLWGDGMLRLHRPER